MTEKRAYALALLTGFLFGATSHILTRIYSTKMPVSLFLPLLLALATSGTAAGGYAALKNTQPERTLRGFFCGIFLALFSHIMTQGFPTHYMLPKADFPLLAPHHSRFLSLCLLLSIGLSASFFALTAFSFSSAFRHVARPNLFYALHIAAVIAGILLSSAAVNKAGGYHALCGITLLFIFLADRPALKMLAALLALTGMLSCTLKKDIFFLWSVKKHRVMSTAWSPYYKLDFVSFDNKECLGGVYNNFMLWYVCRHPVRDHLQRRMIFREVARDRKKVFIVGGSGGVATQTIYNSSAQITLIRAVEIDPVVVNWMKTSFSAYNGNVFKRKTSEMLTAEGRAYLDADSTRYDLIFYDGVDNRLLSFPGSLINIENYLFTHDGYKKVFEKNLTHDGILTIDVGGIESDALYPIISSFPKDVHYTVFWYIVMDYPMLQLPLFFVVASKNKNEVKKMRSRLLTVPSIEPVKVDPKKLTRPATDDHPFIYSQVNGVFTFFVSVFLACVLAMFIKTAKKMRASFSPLSFTHLVIFFLSGAVFTLWEAFLVSKFSRYYFSPALMGLFLLAAMLAGSLAANVIQSALRKTTFLFSLSIVLAVTLTFALMDTKLPAPALFFLAAFCGLACGSFWAFLSSRLKEENRLVLYTMNSLGMVAGVLLFQLVALLFGYHATFLVSAILALFCAAMIFFNPSFADGKTHDFLS